MSERYKRVFALGETLVDIVFSGGKRVRAVPGGSVLNTAVSLARAGIAVELITELREDALAQLLTSFLTDHAIGFGFSTRHQGHKTSLSIAVLDANNDASYSFYNDYPVDVPDGQVPDFNNTDILILGSYYSIRTDRMQRVRKIVASDRQNGALIVYDPNIRPSHDITPEPVRNAIAKNLRSAGIVKGSAEDFAYLSGLHDPQDIYEELKAQCPVMIITAGKERVILFTPGFTKEYPVAPITPVSTIGAGDSFTAGLIFGLMNLPENTIPKAEPSWDYIISCAMAFASATCSTIENYIPKSFILQHQLQR